LTTADGLELAAWYIPGSQPNAIIVVHGINANRAALLPEARVLAGAGYHLLIIDLRGHGHSQGTEVTYGYREALDIQAAIDYLLALPGVEQVGALGNSYGGAAVVRAAAVDKRLEAIVIQSSYSSLPEAVEDAFDDMAVLPKWPFAPLIIALVEKRVGLEISQVDSARDLATIHPRPVLIVHGAEDDLFPVRHAHKMYNAARRPKDLWIVEDLGHASPVKLYEAAYKERVLTFFANAFAKRNQ
jgi:dipeptidyl aminopeptidase/acylaminoacyl peptidase